MHFVQKLFSNIENIRTSIITSSEKETPTIEIDDIFRKQTLGNK